MRNSVVLCWLFIMSLTFAVSSNTTAQNSPITPSPGWADSYSIGGKCYCATTFDHGIGNYTVNTPAGVKTVRDVCNAIGPGPGKSSNPVYNTVQCGHEPAHDDAIIIGGQPVKDEKVCPGRVDQGSGGCQNKGPLWDLSVFDDDNDDDDSIVHSIPGVIEAEQYADQRGTRNIDGSDVDGGQVVGYIENGDYLEYDIKVNQNRTYTVDIRLASATGGSTIDITANGSNVGSLSVPNTGGWKTWRTVSVQAALTTSHNKLRLAFRGGAGYFVDINRLNVSGAADQTELSVNDIEVDEADGIAPVSITLSQVHRTDVTALAFTRADGTATGGLDFYGRTQSIRIPAGATSTTMPVTILKDLVRESAETFSVRLINANGVEIADGVATVTLTDTGNVPAMFSIESTTISEGDGQVTLTVALSQPVDAKVTVFTRPGTATGGNDYYGITQELVFKGGRTEAQLDVRVIDDTAAEQTETMSIHLVNASGALIGTASATVTINDND